MASFTAADVPGVPCPYCAHQVQPVLTNHHLTEIRDARLSGEKYVRAHCITLCPRRDCYQTFYVTVTGRVDGGNNVRDAVAENVWPPATASIDDRIEKQVALDFHQAEVAWVMNLDRAASLMLRRCVENACRLRGATKDVLAEMIDELKDAGKLHPINAVSAHKTRVLGNLTAHLDREVTHTELAKALVLVRKILEDLFVTPALQAEIDTSTRPSH